MTMESDQREMQGTSSAVEVPQEGIKVHDVAELTSGLKVT